jgi:hypothetical protein
MDVWPDRGDKKRMQKFCGKGEHLRLKIAEFSQKF